MKILALSDIYSLDSPVEKLQSIVTTENIDVVILLGGLFPKIVPQDEGKSKSMKKKKKSSDLQNSNILELNWLLIPVLVPQ